MHYRAYDNLGSVLASTWDGDPIVMKAGGQDVVARLSNGVIGMLVGERKILQLKASDRLGGEPIATLRLLPRNSLPKDTVVGAMLRLSHGTTEILLWVVEERADSWMVSTQHPLAGRRIDLHVQIIAREL